MTPKNFRRWKITRHFIYDIVNGVYSGIPFCCVWYWSTGKKPTPNSDAEYGRCDTCHKLNRVKSIRKNGTIMGWIHKI